MSDILLGDLRDIWRDNKDAAEAIETILDNEDFAEQTTLNELKERFDTDGENEVGKLIETLENKVATQAELETVKSELETIKANQTNGEQLVKQDGSIVEETFNFSLLEAGQRESILFTPEQKIKILGFDITLELVDTADTGDIGFYVFRGDVGFTAFSSLLLKIAAAGGNRIRLLNTRFIGGQVDNYPTFLDGANTFTKDFNDFIKKNLLFSPDLPLTVYIDNNMDNTSFDTVVVKITYEEM